MSSQGANLDEDREFTGMDVVILAAASAGMIIFLYIFRFVINIFVIDICILGDCTAWNKICSCLRSGNEDIDRPRRWLTRDALALQAMGAFGDPASFLYSDEIEEEKRKAFLKIITKNELIRKKKIDAIVDQALEANAGEESDEKQDVDIESSSHMSVKCETCSICLGDINNDECLIKNCQHKFHESCLESWISRSLTCPICREDIISRDRLRDYIASNQKVLL